MKNQQIQKTAIEAALELSVASRSALLAPDWFQNLQGAAQASVIDQGLPHARVEAWKYSDLRAARREALDFITPATSAEPQNSLCDDLDGLNISLINGRLSPVDLALPDGLTIKSLSQALVEDGPALEAIMGKVAPAADERLRELNMGFMDDGIFLKVAKNCHVSLPISIAFNLIGETAAQSHSRHVIILEEGADLTLVESHAGSDELEWLSSQIFEVSVGNNARLRQYALQSAGDHETHLAGVRVSLGRDARYESFSLATGAAFSRREIVVSFDGENGSAVLDGVFHTTGDRLCDQTTQIMHKVPRCQASENYRAILEDKSRGVFQGRIDVERHAQKTDSRMMVRALLLSDRAEMDAKPELQIYADDVKCAHGTTIGSLSDEALFYLKSRGIDEASARKLLVAAFTEETIDAISHEGIRDIVRTQFSASLGTQ